MRLVKRSYLIMLAIIALMFVLPYTVFARQKDWLLYWFWTLSTVVVILIGWLETRRWR
ncbi:MAG: hypothetical protein NZ902_03180 [Acidilobaceae archaeon]|nr:hypothetical protein [Acidilobaceae archaeon]MCX8165822.1 hypothetical protein [Acidilobaceae archaeon]MDW7974246.1 hypothetical protein [Sulfolobales archaeon]